MRKALVVGIDGYPSSPLQGCGRDARAMAQLLRRHEDGSPNFHVRCLPDEGSELDAHGLSTAIRELFQGNADIALLYFAGHGKVDMMTNTGFLATSDGRSPSWGVSLSDVLHQANAAHPRIASSVIILDSCNSGMIGELSGLGGSTPAVIGHGVTILTATDRDGLALEGDEHGMFTEIVLDGLGGGCADIRGNITPASLYSHVDQSLGAWEARPVYKANVQTFISLRQVAPKVPSDVLRRLPEYFPTRSFEFPLDPSCEPDRENIPERLRHIPVDPVRSRIFQELQQCNRHGLVVPVGAPHMFHAAIESKACRLTPMGAHYRKLAATGHV